MVPNVVVLLSTRSTSKFSWWSGTPTTSEVSYGRQKKLYHLNLWCARTFWKSWLSSIGLIFMITRKISLAKSFCGFEWPKVWMWLCTFVYLNHRHKLFWSSACNFLVLQRYVTSDKLIIDWSRLFDFITNQKRQFKLVQVSHRLKQ